MRENRQAMNMRAAEATVSSAPKPTKIFPASDVSSQTECSLVLAVAVRGGGGSAPAEATAAAGTGGAPLRTALSASLSWLAATAGLAGGVSAAAAGGASAAGISLDLNCALALATEGGMPLGLVLAFRAVLASCRTCADFTMIGR